MRISKLYRQHVQQCDNLNLAVGGQSDQWVADVQVGILISEGLIPSTRILEIGSGTGRLWLALKKHFDPSGNIYLGIDVVPELTKTSQALVQSLGLPESSVRFETIDKIDDLPFGYEATSVFAFSVFTHMEPEEIYLYLSALRECVAPGGRALFTFLPLETSFGAANFLAESAIPIEERSNRVRNVALSRSFAESVLDLSGWIPELVEWRERHPTHDLNGFLIPNQSWIVCRAKSA